MTAALLHLTSRAVWEAARRSGVYAADTLEGQGFIHCSTAAQILRVANRFYPGQRGLVVLVLDPQRLAVEVRWEPGTDRPEELFPHIYGPISLEAVQKVAGFEPDSDGIFRRMPV